MQRLSEPRNGQGGSAKASGEIIDSDIREFMKQIETVRNASGYHTESPGGLACLQGAFFIGGNEI